MPELPKLPLSNEQSKTQSIFIYCHEWQRNQILTFKTALKETETINRLSKELAITSDQVGDRLDWLLHRFHVSEFSWCSIRMTSRSGIQSKRSNVRSWATLSVEAMFQHQAKCSHFLCVGEPGAIQHPGRIGRALSTYHQKHWATRPVEGFIYKVPLMGKKGGRVSQSK